MSKSDLDLRKMYLAGTIAFPPRQQGQASVTVFSKTENRASIDLVKVEQKISDQVTISRTFFAKDVAAIVETDASQATLWHAGSMGVTTLVKNKLDSDAGSFQGTVYVQEKAPSLLETSAGLTAAECAEYYPPVPQLRTGGSQYVLRKGGCGQDECDDDYGGGSNGGGGNGGGGGGCNGGGGC